MCKPAYLPVGTGCESASAEPAAVETAPASTADGSTVYFALFVSLVSCVVSVVAISFIVSSLNNNNL